MKTVAFLLLSSLLAVPLRAHAATPPRSVWMADYSESEIEGAVASGKTTLIYSGGSSMAVANHVQVARYVVRRVAEELADALVLPVTPQAPAPVPSRRSGRGAPGGAYEIVSQAIRAGGFTDVVVIADEGMGPFDHSTEDLAQRLSADWSPAVHVYYVTGHELRPGQGITFNADYLQRWAGRTIPAEHRKAVEDQAELLFVDPERKFLRPDMIAPEDRGIVVPALGKILLEQRVSSILNQIRTLSPAHLR